MIVRRFARSMQAEDGRDEIPPATAFGNRPRRRRLPHLYTPDEIDALLRAAAQLTPVGSIRPVTDGAFSPSCSPPGSGSPRRSRCTLRTRSARRSSCARRNFEKVGWFPCTPPPGPGSIAASHNACVSPHAIARCLSRWMARACATPPRTPRFSTSPVRPVSEDVQVCPGLGCTTHATRSQFGRWSRARETPPRSRATSWRGVRTWATRIRPTPIGICKPHHG